MVWKTETKLEESPAVIRAVYSTESQSAYYIIDNEQKEHFKDAGYTVALYPDHRKDMETISLIEFTDTLDEAITVLEEKTEEGICDSLSTD